MKITDFYALNFRNYQYCHIETPAMINVFFGKNAQGKTNLLEAIFYGAFGLSHRTAAEDELLRLGSENMAVGIAFASSTSNHQVKLKKYRQQEKWHKEIWLDGAKVRPKEHYGSLPTVMFSPEDLQLVKGEPALRRRFFDMQISQTDSVYYNLLLQYNRVILQRNRLLKMLRENGGSTQALRPWNAQFVKLAAAIIAKRLQAISKLARISQEIYASICRNQENIAIRYELKSNNGEIYYPNSLSGMDEDFYALRLAEREQIDILRGNTGIGPHRDDLQLLLNDFPLRSFGSQGQQRSAALALKLSQLEYIRRQTGEFPILLLDDVMSELDASRRAQLLLFIDGRVQTFITLNERDMVPNLDGSAYFHVVNGSISEE